MFCLRMRGMKWSVFVWNVRMFYPPSKPLLGQFSQNQSHVRMKSELKSLIHKQTFRWNNKQFTQISLVVWNQPGEYLQRGGTVLGKPVKQAKIGKQGRLRGIVGGGWSKRRTCGEHGRKDSWSGERERRRSPWTNLQEFLKRKLNVKQNRNRISAHTEKKFWNCSW